MRRITFLLVLSSFLASTQAADVACREALFESASELKLWHDLTPAIQAMFQRGDLFPPDFVKMVASQGDEILPFIHASGPIVEFHFYLNGTSNKTLLSFTVIMLDDVGTAQVEGLLAQGPDYLVQNRSRRQGREAKGLPLSVFSHVRDRVLGLLGAGGTRQIVIPQTNDVSAYQLFRRLLGARPDGPDAVWFSQVLEEMRIASGMGGIDEFSRQFGHIYREADVEAVAQFKARYPVPPSAVELRRDGFTVSHERPDWYSVESGGSRIHVLRRLGAAPFYLTWKRIHEDCAACVRLARQLSVD